MGWRPTLYNAALVTWLVVLTSILPAVMGPMARARAAHSGGAYHRVRAAYSSCATHSPPPSSGSTSPAVQPARPHGAGQSIPPASTRDNSDGFGQPVHQDGNNGLLEPTHPDGVNGALQFAQQDDDNPWWGILPIIVFVGAAYFVIRRIKRSRQRRPSPGSSPGNGPEVPPIDDRPPEPELVSTPVDRVAEVPGWGQPELKSDPPIVTPARGIFLSYRRDDAEGQAGRLYGDLAQAFGEGSVFMDVAGIGAGLDFRKVINTHVTSCAVLLALIGPEWLDAKDNTGSRRLDDPTDFVRLETAAALRRDIPVVPILVRGARMPRPEQLPDDLKDLAFRNGAELTHARWSSDVEILVKELKQLLMR
jgi:TIR domain-containing protein